MAKNRKVLFLLIALGVFVNLNLLSAFVVQSVTPNIVNRSVPTVVNFTINNTETYNITNITFTLPMESVFYLDGTNTSAIGAGFANGTSDGFPPQKIVVWMNSSASPSGIIPNNSQIRSFWFNISIRNLQNQMFTNITISTRNASNAQNSSSYNYIVYFSFSGFIKNETGGNESNVNVSMYQFSTGQGGPPTETIESSTLTDANGSFSFSALNGSALLYTLKMIRYGGNTNCVSANATCNATKIGSILPAFPPMMYYPTTADNPFVFEFMRPPSLNGTTFYLNPAATLRLYAFGNATLDMQKFGYEVVDQVVGFPTASNFMASVNTTDVIVPTGRNYTAMYVRTPGFGGSSGFAFGASCNGTFMNETTCPSPPISNSTLGTLTAGQILTINQSLNIANYRLTGCILIANGNNNTITMNITNIALKMVPWTGFVPPIKADRGDINLATDVNYSVSTTPLKCGPGLAFYNLSVMGAASGLQYSLEVYAKNVSSASDAVNPGGTAWQLAAFQNITVTGHTVQNLTLRRLTGNYWSGGLGAVNTSTYKINIQNSTGGAITTNMNANLKIKNSDFGTMTYIIESMSSGTFYFPILNNSNWAKIMIFASDAPPKEITLNLSAAEQNITMTSMWEGKGVGMRRINESGQMDVMNSSQLNGSLAIQMRFLRNTGDWGTSCNTLDPASSCLLTSMQAKNFNPLTALVAGKINMEMKIISTNVTLTFINFDMFAAKQPPMDSIMNENASSANGAQQIWQFGSFAPVNTYDYAIIGMPYSDTVINESADINLSAPVLYDENWKIVWNSSRGDTSANLTDDFIDYNSSALYRGYLNSGGLSCSKTDFNLNVTPCYINTTNNFIYMKVPHFSGVGPTITGNAPASSSTSTTTAPGGGGGGNVTEPTTAWTLTYVINENQLNNGYSQVLAVKNRVKLQVEGKEHSIGVVALDDKSATINVSSTPEQVILLIGGSKKFDVTNDSYYDLKVTLNSINNSKANVTIIAINEKVEVAVPTGEQPGAGAGSEENQTTSGTEEKEGAPEDSSKKNKTLIIIFVIIIVVVVVIVVIRLLKEKRYYKRGY